jgi:hypothetical protein
LHFSQLADHRLKTKNEVVLIPQPSDDVNDPLNWPTWKKGLAFAPILVFAALGNWVIVGLAVAIPDLIKEFGHNLQDTAQAINGFPVLVLGVGVLTILIKEALNSVEFLLGSYRTLLRQTPRFPRRSFDVLCDDNLVRKSKQLPQSEGSSNPLRICGISLGGVGCGH